MALSSVLADVSAGSIIPIVTGQDVDNINELSSVIEDVQTTLPGQITDLTDTVNELSSSISSIEIDSQFFDLTATSAQTDDEVLATAQDPKDGDIAVVKRLIGTEGDYDSPEDYKYSYTAYVYDVDTDTRWKATDGNYNANNVYFNDDLTYTADIGVLQVPASGSGTLSAAGKNLATVLSQILAQEKAPTVSNPSIALTLNGAGAKEVGSTVNITYTTTFNKGNYQYGPDTGVTISSWSIKDSTNTTTVSGTTDWVKGNQTFGTPITVTDTTDYYLSGYATWTAGVAPKSNIGNDVTSAAIKAGSATKTTSHITGYRKYYLAINTGDISSFTQDTVDQLKAFIISNGTTGAETDNVKVVNNGKNSASQITTSLTNVAIPQGTRQVVLMLPQSYGRTLKSVVDVDGMGLVVTNNFVESQISFNGIDAADPVPYRVYVATTDNPVVGYAATKYDFTIE